MSFTFHRAPTSTASIDSSDPPAYIPGVKPGDLERRLSRLLSEATTARDRLQAMSREIDAVRSVIGEIAATIRGPEGSKPAAGAGETQDRMRGSGVAQVEAAPK